MARAVSHAPPRRADRRTAAWRAAESDRRSGGGHHHPDVGSAAGRDAVEYAHDGRGRGAVEGDYLAHLADLWAAIASRRYVQTVRRPAVYRESARHCRA